jgi:hypothetical protein
MSKIKFYPVDNGDTVLIKVPNATVQIDANIRDNNDCYDVMSDILNELVTDNKGRYHLDLFMLTHPDEDHCRGIDNNYYLGDPDKYSDSDKENDLVIIDELMVTPMLFTDATSSSAKALKKEANRRRNLYDDNSPAKDKAGNRLVIIGYDGNKRYDKVPSYIPGDSIKEINGKIMSLLEFFVHSPFKDSLVEGRAEADKNGTSIVMQARFKYLSSDTQPSALYLFGGDADHYIWKEIQNQSKNHNNDKKLDFDIFMAPHHCSWTYFNDVPYKKGVTDTPVDSSKNLITKHKTSGAVIIASSKQIKDDDDNPPHYPAKEEYIKLIGSDKFISLAEEPDSKNPKPVIYEVTSSGFQRKDKNQQTGSTGAAIGSSGTSGRKSSYGSK